MELKEAIEILKNHNLWRRGEIDDTCDPVTLGIAIDTIVNHYENGR